MTSDAPAGAAVGVVPGPGVPKFELSPHNCFACGTLNTHGLRLLLHVEPGRSSVEFRKPVEVGRPFLAEGWVTRSRRRLVDTSARLVDSASGTELATAEGVYFAAAEARKKELRERYGFRVLDDARTDIPDSVERAR